MKNYKNKSTDNLVETILALKTKEQCYNFLEDLCTIKEIQDMSQRLDTAILLDSGESYQSISEKVGVSSATISRVNNCLNYGTGGYKSAIDNLKKD